MQSSVKSKAHDVYKDTHGTTPENDGYYHIAELNDETVIYGKTQEAIDAFIKAQKILNRMTNTIIMLMLFVIAPLCITFLIELEKLWTIIASLLIIVVVFIWVIRSGKKCRTLEQIYSNQVTTIKFTR